MIYRRVLEAARRDGLRPDHRVLVVCGGDVDRLVLQDLGFEHVTISNLDDRMAAEAYRPYDWSYQDAERLTFADDSFDWVLVHAGLHHCAVPHQALAEMLRVARIGIVVVESQDGLLMRLAVRAGLVAEYEVEAVVDNGGTHGGVANTCVPNHVYRWTEREVRKAVASARPQVAHRIDFHHGWSSPADRLAMSTSPRRRVAGRLLDLVCAVGQRVAPRQGNDLAFVVWKQGDLQPWLTEREGRLELDRTWAGTRYRPSRTYDSGH